MLRPKGIATRVLIVEPSGLLWGSERALLDLLGHLDQGEFQLIVACPARTPLVERIRALNVDIIHLPIRDVNRGGIIRRVVMAIMLLLVTAFVRPHVIHLNQAGIAQIGGAIGWLLGVPVICHVRLRREAERLAARIHSRFRPAVRIAISADIARRMDHVTSDVLIYDPFDSRSFVQQAGSQEESRGALRAQLNLPPDAVVLTVAARLSHEKGIHVAIEALSILVADSTNVCLVVLGEPPNGDLEAQTYADELVQTVASATWGANVRFMGLRDDVAAVMNGSDVIVLPSFGEPFGRVLLEAMSLRIPCVATDAGGAAEIIGNDERGLTFPPGDAQSLANAIRATLNDGAATILRTDRAAGWVSAVCAPELHAQQVSRVYRTVAS